MTRPTDGDVDIEETWFILIVMALIIVMCTAVGFGAVDWILGQLPWWLK